MTDTDKEEYHQECYAVHCTGTGDESEMSYERIKRNMLSRKLCSETPSMIPNNRSMIVIIMFQFNNQFSLTTPPGCILMHDMVHDEHILNM